MEVNGPSWGVKAKHRLAFCATRPWHLFQLTLCQSERREEVNVSEAGADAVKITNQETFVGLMGLTFLSLLSEGHRMNGSVSSIHPKLSSLMLATRMCKPAYHRFDSLT